MSNKVRDGDGMSWKTLSRFAFFSVTAVLLVAVAIAFIASSGREDEAYAVYSAYIENSLTGESHSLGDRQSTVLIAARATMVAELNTLQRWRLMIGSLAHLRNRQSPPERSLVVGLFLSNLGTHRFTRRFEIPAEYELLDQAELALPSVHERFPRSYGYVTLSSVEFSSDGNDALFYTEHICGLCGGGEYVLMRKHRDRWAIVNRYSTWVS